MLTLTVTSQQAHHLASLVQQVRQAQQTLDSVVSLLCLGHPLPAGATLAHIDCDSGDLTFSAPDDARPLE